MTVTINGERREVPDGIAVSALLDHLGMPRERVAIERNLNILPRADWKRRRCSRTTASRSCTLWAEVSGSGLLGCWRRAS